jgi:hypothetical protein
MGAIDLEFPVPDAQRTLAAALAGDRRALVDCAESPALQEASREHRLQAALALRARECRVENQCVADWRADLQRIAGRQLLFQASLEQVGACLAATGVNWIVLKGMDLATRVFDHPEERPSTDIDLLIDPGDYPRARAALEDSGWQSVFAGRAYDDWVIEEGHAWTAVHSRSRVALEVHFRLWGMVSDRAGQDLLSAACADDLLPPGGHRLPLAHAFVVAATHCLLDAPPRPLFQWWDMERIIAAGGPDLVPTIIKISRHWEIELVTALAAAQVEALWQNRNCARIAEDLGSSLRRAERWLARRAARNGLDSTGASLSLARLVSGRSTRAGWQSVWRHVWAHPGMIAQETPDEWPPWLRRTYHVLNALELRQLARRLARGHLDSTSRKDVD